MAEVPIRFLVLIAATMACSSKPPSAPTVAQKTFAQTLSEYGFVELRPPSTLLPPGTIVRLRSREPLVAQIVCTQKGALGANVALESSDSKSTAFDSSASTSYRLDASIVPILSAKSEYQSIASVTMRLTNVHVIEIPDAAVYDGLAQRSSGCARAVADLQGEPSSSLSMIKSVLSADATYGVDFKSSASVDAGVRLALVKSLAADLGADSNSATEASVEGRSLYWGVTDEIRLAEVSFVEGPALPAGNLPAGDLPGGPIPGPPIAGEGRPTPSQLLEGRAARGERALPVTAGALSIDPTPLGD